MDFRPDDATRALAAEVRAFLADAIDDELEERLYRTGASFDPEFTAALVERGWLAVGWTERWADGEAPRHDPLEFLALRDEQQRADAPMYAVGTTMLVAKALLKVGTREQQEAVIPKALRGELLIVLGFSEPEAGSDVASAATRAVRDGDEWVIDGSKMFTTNADVGDFVFLLTRTNPDVPRHQGLTTFLVPLDQAGVEVQPVVTLSGERTNVTYYQGVRVADRWRVGEVDGGWQVMLAALQEEHTGGYGGRLERLLEEAEAWACEPAAGEGAAAAGRPIDDDDVRVRLARLATEHEVARLLQVRAACMVRDGRVPEAEGPMAKLFSSEALVRAAQDLVEVMGPDGIRSYFDPTAPRNGRIEHLLRFSLGTTIYAGTSEIQRTIIATRGLHLPR